MSSTYVSYSCELLNKQWFYLHCTILVKDTDLWIFYTAIPIKSFFFVFVRSVFLLIVGKECCHRGKGKCIGGHTNTRKWVMKTSIWCIDSAILIMPRFICHRSSLKRSLTPPIGPSCAIPIRFIYSASSFSWIAFMTKILTGASSSVSTPKAPRHSSWYRSSRTVTPGRCLAVERRGWENWFHGRVFLAYLIVAGFFITYL